MNGETVKTEPQEHDLRVKPLSEYGKYGRQYCPLDILEELTGTHIQIYRNGRWMDYE